MLCGQKFTPIGWGHDISIFISAVVIAYHIHTLGCWRLVCLGSLGSRGFQGWSGVQLGHPVLVSICHVLQSKYDPWNFELIREITQKALFLWERKVLQPVLSKRCPFQVEAGSPQFFFAY